MAYYYFLMAQLPAIMPGSRPLVSYNEFFELASRYLSRKDFSVINKLTIDPPREGYTVRSSVVNQWYEQERALRLSLAKLRGQKLNRPITVSSDESEALSMEVTVAQAARNACTMDNPLEAERYLLRIRTNWLEELRGNHFFDSEAVFMYGLSLLLRERSDRFTVEAGQDAYESIYTQILGEEA